MNSKKRNENIKQPSLFTRAYDKIGDSYLNFITRYDVDDIESICKRIKWPVIILLYSAFIIVHFSRLYEESERAKIEKLFNANQNMMYNSEPRSYGSSNTKLEHSANFSLQKTAFSKMLVAVELGLIFSSFFISAMVLSSTKKYQIRGAGKDDYKGINGISQVAELENEYMNDSFSASSIFKHKKEAKKRFIFELYIWDPSEFSLSLLCWWSPIHLAIAFLINTKNWYYMAPIAILASFQIQFLVSKFVELDTHKKIIMEQVYNEYNAGFVYPRLFKKTRDMGTITDPDESLLINLNNQLSTSSDKYLSGANHRNTNPTCETTSSTRDYLTNVNSPIAHLKKNTNSSSGNRTPYLRTLISTSSPLFSRTDKQA